MKKFIYLLLMMGGFMVSHTHANETYVLYDGKTHKTDGTYKATYNKNGAVLRMAKHTLRLGKSCDAISTKYGKGRWWWANGGWGIDFDGGKTLVSSAQAEAPSIRGNDCH